MKKNKGKRVIFNNDENANNAKKKQGNFATMWYLR